MKMVVTKSNLQNLFHSYQNSYDILQTARHKKAIIHMELQRSWITREIRRIKEYSWRYPNTCSKLYQWAIMPKPRWHWHKKEKQTNGYRISDKGTKTCKEKNLFKNGAGIVRYTPAEEWNLIHIFILYTSALSESKILI